VVAAAVASLSQPQEFWPARLPWVMGLWPLHGGDEPGVLHVVAHDPAGHRGGAGIYRAVGIGIVRFAPMDRFCLDRAGDGRAGAVVAIARANSRARSDRRDVRAGCWHRVGTV